MMGIPRLNRTGVKYLLAGGTLMAAIGVLLDPAQLLPASISMSLPVREDCQEVVDAAARLSRQKLSQLLAMPERSPQTQVRQLLPQPYCRLAALNVRSGATARREAYPMEFDTDTWLVVLYEGEEYVGYDFIFRR